MSVYVWMCIGTRQIFPKWPLLCAKNWPKWVPTWTPGSQRFASPMSKLIATSIRRTKYSVHCTKACLIIFLMSFNFTYFFLISFPISCCIHRMLELTGLIQFWDWIGLGHQGSKLFWGGLGPQGPKCSFFDVLQFHIFFFLFHFQFPFAYTAPDAGANRFDPVLGLNRDLRTQNCFWAD